MPGEDSKTYAHARGSASDFDTALTAVTAFDFTPEAVDGLTFYPDGTGQVAYFDGESLEVRFIDGLNEWLWELSIPEQGALRRVAALFGTYRLSGSAAGKLDAVVAAKAAQSRLKILCAELIGDDSFESGRQAGRAELRAAISGLQF